jgi:hypothetical protein
MVTSVTSARIVRVRTGHDGEDGFLLTCGPDVGPVLLQRLGRIHPGEIRIPGSEYLATVWKSAYQRVANAVFSVRYEEHSNWDETHMTSRTERFAIHAAECEFSRTSDKPGAVFCVDRDTRKIVLPVANEDRDALIAAYDKILSYTVGWHIIE